jgi:hypothetical protein
MYTSADPQCCCIVLTCSAIHCLLAAAQELTSQQEQMLRWGAAALTKAKRSALAWSCSYCCLQLCVQMLAAATQQLLDGQLPAAWQACNASPAV